MKKILVVYIYGIMLPSYNFGIMGIKIHHYKDPYLNSQYKVSNKNPYHKESTIF